MTDVPLGSKLLHNGSRFELSLCSVVIGVCVNCQVYTVLGWLFGSGSAIDTVTSRPMTRWSHADTMTWLGSVGHWAYDALEQNFTRLDIGTGYCFSKTKLYVLVGRGESLTSNDRMKQSIEMRAGILNVSNEYQILLIVC